VALPGVVVSETSGAAPVGTRDGSLDTLTAMQECETHSNPLANLPDRRLFLSSYEALAANGLTPEIVEVSDDELVMCKYPKLEDWLRGDPSADGVEAMGRRLAVLL
jgi:hypothetical protein